MKHISVFNKQAIDWMDIQEGGIYIDTTLGAGGHTKSILQSISGGDVKVIAFDYDEEAISAMQDYAQKHGNLLLVHASFSELETQLQSRGITSVEGVLADLGWSSDQLDHVAGLSYMKEDQQLDMRLNSSLKASAADVLNLYSKDKLKSIFEQYGELDTNEAVQIVDLLQALKPVAWTVAQFNELIEKVKSRRQHNLRARAYQALRIEVNGEFENLLALLNQGSKLLKKGGRLVIITFHSLEEKILTEFMYEKLPEGIFKNLIQENLTKGIGFLRPSVEELRENIHAHSAKLWAFEKLT